VRPDFFFEDRQALFLDSAGIDSRLVHDNVAALDDFSNRIGGRKDRTQIRPAGTVDGSGHCHDIKIGAGQTRWLVFEPQRRLLEVGRRDFERAVVSGPQLLDALRIDIKADDRRPGSGECDGNWQSDVPETDNSELPAVAQNYGPLGCAARLRIECPFIRGKFPRHTPFGNSVTRKYPNGPRKSKFLPDFGTVNHRSRMDLLQPAANFAIRIRQWG
jgi:hypothetical protein